MPGFYRDIFKTSWRTIWRLKFLWFFGVFVALTSSNGEYDIIAKNFSTITNFEYNIKYLKETGENLFGTMWKNTTALLPDNTIMAVLILLAGLVILAAAIYLITVSQTALINAAARFRRGQKSGFLEGFFTGTKFFWPIFILNLFAKIIVYGLLIVLCLPLILIFVFNAHSVYLYLASILAFLIYIPLNILIAFLVRYASMYIVLESQPVKKAVKSSLSLFRRYWLITLENAVILYVINFIITYLVVAVMIFAELPYTSIGYTIFTLITVFVGALIASFQFSAWTNIFILLKEGGLTAKIIRLFRPQPKEENIKL